MADNAVIYVGNNAKEFDDYVFNLALERGKYGLEFIASLQDGDSCLPAVKGDIDENAQLLFADLIKLVSPLVYEIVRESSNFKLWRKTANVYELWAAIHAVDSEVIKQHTIAKIQQKKDNAKDYSIVHGFKSLLSGDYIVASWAVNRNASDLQGDIVDLNTNLGIIGALIITMAFPMFQGADFQKGSWECMAYILLTGVCGVLESASVLLCIRNIVVINLVEAENVNEFVAVASPYLIAPVKFNLIAIVCLIVALAIFAFWNYNDTTGWIFVFGINVPAIFFFLYYTAGGIRSLYQVQPWDVKEILDIDSAKEKANLKTVVVSSSKAIHPSQ